MPSDFHLSEAAVPVCAFPHSYFPDGSFPEGYFPCAQVPPPASDRPAAVAGVGALFALEPVLVSILHPDLFEEDDILVLDLFGLGQELTEDELLRWPRRASFSLEDDDREVFAVLGVESDLVLLGWD